MSSPRINSQLQQALAELVRELKDPRLGQPGLIAIAEVRVTPDVSRARVFVTVADRIDCNDVVAVLQRAAGRLRGQLSRRLRLRRAPELLFIPDQSFDRANRIEQVLAEIAVEDEKGEGGDD
ncbi:MAG: 30S ribosome-binding factor RbfA [Deltaproteobacteria bacterium]|nr:30S ribosome-binding factor RbfA [Deltaproteobacteria bacterium]